MLGRIKRKVIDHIAEKNKRQFLKWIDKNQPQVGNILDIDMVSFSGANFFADQVYSIHTFYHNIGTPHSWTIYNDGTYSNEQLDILKKIGRVCIADISSVSKALPEAALINFPTLFKIEILRNISPRIPVIFTDSDILFYKGFNRHKKILEQDNWYIADEGFRYFDAEYIANNKTTAEPLNLGFMVLNSKPDWGPVINYIIARFNEGKLDYWTDQTACHIMAQNENFKVLPKQEFVVGGNDSFKFRSAVDYDRIALRHFVGPVRHKMWQYPWKKVLGIHL